MLCVLRSKYPLTRATAFYFLPLLYPYQFVAFTDVAGLAVLAGCALGMAETSARDGRCHRQSRCAVASVEHRGAGLLAADGGHRARRARDAQLRVFAQRTWTCLLGVAAFLAFIVINHGVAIGDHGMHRLGVHVGNVFLGLFVLCCVSLPVLLSTLWSRRRALASAAFVGTVLVVCGLYAWQFEVTHHYNTLLMFLHNALLDWATRSTAHKALFFVPIVLALALLWTTRFSRMALIVWLLVSLVALLPEGLIEQRYSLLPVRLFTLFRKDTTRGVELSTAVCNAALSSASLWVMVDGRWSL